MKSLISILFFSTATVVSYGQNLIASPSIVKIGLNEKFTIVWDFNDTIEKFTLPEMPNFLVDAPLISTSNGTERGNIKKIIYTYSYTFHPLKKGEFIIQPAKAKYRGNSFSSNPVKVIIISERPELSKEIVKNDSPDKWHLCQTRKIVAKIENSSKEFDLYKNIRISWTISDTTLKFQCPQILGLVKTSTDEVMKNVDFWTPGNSFLSEYAANQIGTYIIPSVIIKLNNIEYRSNEIKIKVVNQIRDESMRDSFADKRDSFPDKQIKEYFLTASADKSKMNMGDSAIISYKIYFRNTKFSDETIGFRSLKNPICSNGTIKFINNSCDSSYHDENILNVNYKVYTIGKWKVSENNKGKVNLSSLICLANITGKTHDPFDRSSFDDPLYEYTCAAPDPFEIMPFNDPLYYYKNFKAHYEQKYLISNELTIKVE